jgi:hypothetical protein
MARKESLIANVDLHYATAFNLCARRADTGCQTRVSLSPQRLGLLGALSIGAGEKRLIEGRRICDVVVTGQGLA